MIALIFLGFGWNFLFISGTSLVVLTYKEEEKFKAQGINDFIVFSTMAIASLLAGILLILTSWKTMNLICIPFLILIIKKRTQSKYRKKKSNRYFLFRMCIWFWFFFIRQLLDFYIFDT